MDKYQAMQMLGLEPIKKLDYERPKIGLQPMQDPNAKRKTGDSTNGGRSSGTTVNRKNLEERFPQLKGR